MRVEDYETAMNYLNLAISTITFRPDGLATTVMHSFRGITTIEAYSRTTRRMYLLKFNERVGVDYSDAVERIVYATRLQMACADNEITENEFTLLGAIYAVQCRGGVLSIYLEYGMLGNIYSRDYITRPLYTANGHYLCFLTDSGMTLLNTIRKALR